MKKRKDGRYVKMVDGVLFYGATEREVYRKIMEHAETVELGEKNALADEMNDFIMAVQKSRETGKLCQPKVTGQDGLKALKLALDIEAEARRYCAEYGIAAK